MEEIFDQMNNEVDKNTVDKQCAEIEKKNLLIENENLIVNYLSTQLLLIVENHVGNFCDSDLRLPSEKHTVLCSWRFKGTDILKVVIAPDYTRYRLMKLWKCFSNMPAIPKLPSPNHGVASSFKPFKLGIINDLAQKICEDLGKFQAKADIGIFVGYAPSRKGYRIYNKRTRRLMETIHVTVQSRCFIDGSCTDDSDPEKPFIHEPWTTQ
ncbi:hypothetical protein Tco_1182120 [Tanacetum coccineum]